MLSFYEQKKRSDLPPFAFVKISEIFTEIIEHLQYMYVDARRQRYFKISCDTRIVDLTCLSAGRKEISAFAVGIFTSLVCEKTCFNTIKQTRVDLESKTRRRKARRVHKT